MASEPKMVPTGADVDEYLEGVSSGVRRADARTLVDLMTSVTGEPPVVWGSGIVGFGQFEYRLDSGRTGISPLAAFAPRKANMVVYLTAGYEERFADLVGQLGPHTSGSSCLYLKRLDSIDLGVLEQLIELSLPDDGADAAQGS